MHKDAFEQSKVRWGSYKQDMLPAQAKTGTSAWCNTIIKVAAAIKVPIPYASDIFVLLELSWYWKCSLFIDLVSLFLLGAAGGYFRMFLIIFVTPRLKHAVHAC